MSSFFVEITILMKPRMFHLQKSQSLLGASVSHFHFADWTATSFYLYNKNWVNQFVQNNWNSINLSSHVVWSYNNHKLFMWFYWKVLALLNNCLLRYLVRFLWTYSYFAFKTNRQGQQAIFPVSLPHQTSIGWWWGRLLIFHLLATLSTSEIKLSVCLKFCICIWNPKWYCSALVVSHSLILCWHHFALAVRVRANTVQCAVWLKLCISRCCGFEACYDVD